LAISASLPTPLNNLSNSRIDFSFLSNTCFFIAVHPLIDLPVCLIAYKTSILNTYLKWINSTKLKHVMQAKSRKGAVKEI
jgi:hypothetical protein